MLSSEIPLVFIHGYKGCSLIDTNTNKTKFLTLSQALNTASSDLSLPTTWIEGEGVQDNEGDTTPGPPLADPLGSFLSTLLKARVYAPLLKTLETEYGVPVLASGPDQITATPSNFYTFTYDWRRSNNETVVLLQTFLEKLPSPPQVIAHSNGGLLLYSILNKNPTLVHSVIYAAVPFKGNLTFLPDLTEGKKIGFNKTMLSGNVQKTFPLPYHIFPYRSEAAGLFVNSNG
jgi:pimeloyl-ACP methyl ester carboxylesterase